MISIYGYVVAGVSPPQDGECSMSTYTCSPAFEAAVCAWLLRAVARIVEIPHVMHPCSGDMRTVVSRQTSPSAAAKIVLHLR